LSCLSLSRTS